MFSSYNAKVTCNVWVNTLNQIKWFDSGKGATVLCNISVKNEAQENVSWPVRLLILDANMVIWLENQVSAGVSRFQVNGQFVLDEYVDNGYKKAGMFAEVVMESEKKPAIHERTQRPYGVATLQVLVDSFEQSVNRNNVAFYLPESDVAEEAVEEVYETATASNDSGEEDIEWGF